MRGWNWAITAGSAASRRCCATSDLDDPALWTIAGIVHEADLADERFDALVLGRDPARPQTAAGSRASGAPGTAELRRNPVSRDGAAPAG